MCDAVLFFKVEGQTHQTHQLAYHKARHKMNRNWCMDGWSVVSGYTVFILVGNAAPVMYHMSKRCIVKWSKVKIIKSRYCIYRTTQRRQALEVK